MLALLSVCVTALNTNKKSLLSSVATSVAQRELDRAIYAAVSDLPAGARGDFWDLDFPYPTAAWSAGTTRVGATDLSYAIYAHSVNDALSGGPLGLGSMPARVKKVDIIVWWWGEAEKARQGFGRLQVCASRLVSENEAR